MEPEKPKQKEREKPALKERALKLETLLVPDVAIQRASTAVEIFKESRLSFAFKAAQPRTSTLVQRIDLKDSFYFIVSFQESAGREAARIIIDAFDGTLIEASGIIDASDSFDSWVSQGEALDRMLAVREASKVMLDVPFRREFIGVHPVLVWRPCRQSLSPFQPFYQFSVGGALVYLRTDGVLFDRLQLPPEKSTRRTRGGGRAVSKNRRAARPRY